MRNIKKIAKQIKNKTSLNIAPKELKPLAKHIEAFNETINMATYDVQQLQNDVTQWLLKFYKLLWEIISKNKNFTENNHFMVISSILICEVIENTNTPTSKLIANHILFPIVEKFNKDVFNQIKPSLDSFILLEGFVKIRTKLIKGEELAETFNQKMYLEEEKNILPQISKKRIKQEVDNTKKDEEKFVQSQSTKPLSEELEIKKTKEEKLNEQLKELYQSIPDKRKEVEKKDESKDLDLTEEKECAPFKEIDSRDVLLEEMNSKFRSTRDFNEIKKIASYVKIQLLEHCTSPAELNYYTAMVNSNANLRMLILGLQQTLDETDKLKLSKQNSFAVNELEIAQKEYFSEIKPNSQAKESKPKKIEFFGRFHSSLFWSGKRTKITDQFFQHRQAQM